MKTILLTTALLLSTLNASLIAQWQQVGQDILGQAEDGYAGYSVSMSNDGLTIVLGDRNAVIDELEGVGEANVYTLESGEWMPKGEVVLGTSEYGWCGHDVSLDASGDVLAVSSINTFNAEDNSTGSVRVYDWDGSNWTQRGGLIEGDDNVLGFVTFFGYGIDMSDDGNAIIIGGPEKWSDDGSLAGPGYSKIFDWDGSAWTQRGMDLYGEAEQMSFGKAVSISNDGQIVAIGGPRLGNLFEELGVVRVFDWNGIAWVQKGQDILGTMEGDDLGEAVSIANNGNTIAVGAPGYVVGSANVTGEVRVYDWDGATWIQRGEDLVSIEAIDAFGTAVSLSDDGMRLGVSAQNLTNNDPIAGNAGAAIVYEWNGSEWFEISAPILGTESGEYAGALELSSDGNTFIIGSFGFAPGGRARVYRDHLTSSTLEESMLDFAVYPNPSDGLITIISNEDNNLNVIVYNSGGQTVYTDRLKGQGLYELDLEIAEGIYYLVLITEEALVTRRISIVK
tara:strand:- start:134 stop:1654 length:1521 start_codon:yes stop_codon:yes gene_type:complete